MENTTLTRKELYDLVWAEPISSLAKKYLISDNHLRKVCKQFDIPLPANGYWSKKQFGKTVEVIQLDKSYMDNKEINLTPTLDEFTLLKVKQKEIEDSLGKALELPERLNRPDPLITEYKKSFSEEITYGGTYYTNKHTPSLNINVKGSQLSRAILIMDTLIKAVKRRGHKIVVEETNTKFVIDGEAFVASLRLKNKRTEIENPRHSYDRYETVATNILVFKIEGWRGKEWSDGSTSLESQLSRIIAKLEVASSQIKIEKEERRIRHEREEQERQIELAFQQRKEKELTDFKSLLADSKRWKTLMILREFIDFVANDSTDNTRMQRDKEEWIKWAKEKADWYDPAINLHDELLDSIDKNTLEPKKVYTKSWW